MIYIFTVEGEQSTNEVIDWLNYFRASFVRINLLKDLVNLNFLMSSYNGFSFEIQIDRKSYRINKDDIIWYRRGFLEDVSSNIIPDDLRHLEKEVVSLIVLFAFVILFFWILFNTSYLIENGCVHYKSGPVKGKIEIDSIRKIKMNANLYSGLKPALAFKGIIVYYRKYDEIYFSPKTNESFVEELLKINNNITIEK